jgi:glycosyltransferase involved in cell wall biosynthesis
MSRAPSLTVVIAVYNGEDTIRECLEHAYASTFRDFEVIVVDDCSTDRTERIVRSFPCQFLCTPANSGPGAARNLGAGRATGRFLYFVDADILVNPDTFSQIVESFSSRPEFSAMFGSFQKNTVPEDFASVYKNLQHHYTHQTSNEEASTFCGGFGAIRREAFLEVGGFNPAWRYMEDVDLGYRLRRAGHRIWLNKNLQSTHLKRYTLAGLVRSDVVGRAIPWTRVMLEARTFQNDLNTRSHNIASVPASFLLLGLLVRPIAWAPFTLFLAIVFLALNRGFLGFCWRERRALFTARAALMCWFGYLYSAVGAGIGLLHYLRAQLKGPAAFPAPAIRADDTR